MVAIIDRGSAIEYIRAKAVSLNLDPAAVLAISKQEGIGGGIGDGGHAFGPFQLNDAGGSFPASLMGLSTTAKQEWAWSTEGIDYALQHIAAVAAGQTGSTAIASIATFFERPADIPNEIRKAIADYPLFTNGAIPSVIDPGGSPIVTVPGQIPGQVPGQVPGQGTVTPTINQDVKLFSTPLGNIGIPSGLILGLWAFVLLLIGALLTFVVGKQSKVQVNVKQAA